MRRVVCTCWKHVFFFFPAACLVLFCLGRTDHNFSHSHSLTFVTCLHDIGRSKYDRPFRHYLKWITKTLEIRAPMVAYVDKMLEKRVTNFRAKRSLPTIVYGIQQSEIPYFHLEKRISEIQRSERYKNQMAQIDRIECQLPLYTVVQYSKFQYLASVAAHDPFNTTFFFWIDAGLSRLLSDVHLRHDVRTEKMSNDKIHVQIQKQFFTLGANYLWSSDNIFVGGLFGGSSAPIKWLNSTIDAWLIRLLNASWINNEQILMAHLYTLAPSKFVLIKKSFYPRQWMHIQHFIWNSKY